MQSLIPAVAVLLLLGPPFAAEVLEVGPGRKFDRIETALAAAKAGATIMVYPRGDGAPYERVACFVDKPRITFRGVGPKPVVLSGEGFAYSGVGRTPRAMFQFMPGADHGRVENFELRDASNRSHNGAGVRIVGANHVTIAGCNIHDNDMGIMSNGNGTLEYGLDQVITRCRIHHNGTEKEPGQNHNLYLGGASVTVRFCEVSHSLTGHNLKSRAHHTQVEYCFIHDSANREFDLVDDRVTARPESHAVLLGNIIVKAQPLDGNRGVIHFGQDGGGAHDGTLFLAFNTIVTPYGSPVVLLTSPVSKANLVGNIVWDRRAGGRQTIAMAAKGAKLENVTGERNWFASGFAALQATGIRPELNFVAARDADPGFADPARGDYRLARKSKRVVDAGPGRDAVKLPPVPGATVEPGPFRAWQYGAARTRLKRPDEGALDLGACGFAD